jgi:aminoglycoside phosphotransferase (APT) family kinase protein
MTVVADSPAARGIETAVAGLRHALDASGMRGRLERMLWPGGGGAVERVVAGKLLYRTDGTCSLRYAVTVRQPGRGRREVTVGARVLSDAPAAEAFLRDLEPIRRAAAGHPLLEGLDAAVALDPTVPMAVHAFPIEPELPGLPEATDATRAGELLGAAFGGAVAGPVRVEVAHHPREGRCTLRYRPSAGGTVYAKVARRHSPEQAAAMRAIAAGARELRVPRFLGAQPALGLTLQAEVAGTPAASALLDPTPTARRAAAIDACARAAARVHACPVSIPRVRTAETDAALLRNELDLVRPVDPGLAEHLEGCIERALNAAQANGPGPVRPCHGDLTHRQIVIERGVPGLIDFDDVCMGEPALDLGRFCAYLRLSARRAAETAGCDHGDPMCGRFLRTYADEAGAAPRARRRLEGRARVHETLALVHVAISGWRQAKPARLARARSLLEAEGACPRR